MIFLYLAISNRLTNTHTFFGLSVDPFWKNLFRKVIHIDDISLFKVISIVTVTTKPSEKSITTNYTKVAVQVSLFFFKPFNREFAETQSTCSIEV